MAIASALAAMARRVGLRYDDVVAALPVPEQAHPTHRLNRVCHPDAWEDPEWLRVNRSLRLPDGPNRYHRKQFEWTQCVFGLELLGVLRPTTRILGVGAGHECVLYHFANHCGLVVATDLYRGAFATGPAAEADASFLRDPDRYAPFPYRRDRLRALPADGCALPFRDGSFDVVYSLSSIEHFGGHDRATAAMREMCRVLRPGGICCVATELILEGGDHPEFFTREELDQYVVRGSRMVLLERIDERPMPRQYIDDPVWIHGDVHRVPHLVLGLGPLRWTSVVLFLRKPTTGDLARGVVRLLRRRLATRLWPGAGRARL
jgi:SAM-dependent methyltransferase